MVAVTLTHVPPAHNDRLDVNALPLRLVPRTKTLSLGTRSKANHVVGKISLVPTKKSEKIREMNTLGLGQPWSSFYIVRM